MINTLLRRFLESDPHSDDQREAAGDLQEASVLLTANLGRAHRLVESFKMLSVGQLSDHRMSVDLRSVIRDCVETMRPVTRKGNLAIHLHLPETPLPWDGFPGHLSQVMVNFIQNVLRYAYPGREDGTLDIRALSLQGGSMYRIEVEDQGVGLAAEVRDRIFQPFVTTGRSQGGTGLGLAITHNIVTNLLRGAIQCSSTPGKGTRFVVEVPASVPNPPPTDGADTRAAS
jgi:signal transduction histidine kinase